VTSIDLINLNLDSPPNSYSISQFINEGPEFSGSDNVQLLEIPDQGGRCKKKMPAG